MVLEYLPTFAEYILLILGIYTSIDWKYCHESWYNAFVWKIYQHLPQKSPRYFVGVYPLVN